MNRLGRWLVELSNFIDTRCPPLFYFIPEYYANVSFDIMRLFLRVDIPTCEFIWVNESTPFKNNSRGTAGGALP